MTTTPQSYLHKNITEHVDQVSSLKKKAMDLMYDHPERTPEQCATVTKIVCKMRKIHGCSIYDYYKCIERLSKKGSENVTNEEWEALSADKTLLHIMHNCIRCVEKKLYSNKDYSDKSGSSYTSSSPKPPNDQHTYPKSDSRDQHPYQRQAFYDKYIQQKIDLNDHTMQSGDYTFNVKESGKFRLKLNKDGDISISEQPSNSISEYSLTPYNTLDLLKQTGGNDADDTETVPTLGESTLEKLGREEASPLSSLFGGEPKSFDKTKPTVITIWANWCGYSRRFIESGWKEFKKLFNQDETCEKLEVQCFDIDIGNNSQLAQRLKEEFGVNSYPTTVFVHGAFKKVYPNGSRTTGKEILGGVHESVAKK